MSDTHGPVVLVAALIGCLLAGSAVCQPTVVREVVVAVSPDRTKSVSLSGREGLVITGWSGPGDRLVLGDGAYPRFAVDGTLYFERSTDDGHRILSMSRWALDLGSRVPRTARPREVVPEYHLPPPDLAEGVATKVCIDPGHGGSDPGASGFGLLEKDITLDVASKLAVWLDRDSGDGSGGGLWSVLLTRTGDVYVSLSARANMANAFGAASFLSVHMNSFTSSSANGTETYCYPGQETNAGGRLRDVVQKEALAAWKLTNRGVKAANFAVLRQTAMPAALLEGGFITSPVDVVLLGDPQAQDQLALAALYALQQHHGFSRYQPAAGPLTGKLRGVVYDASQGTPFRLGGALVALDDGAFTFSRQGDGYFEFVVAAGSRDYAATAPGFDASAGTALVPAGGEVWGRLGLAPANVPRLTVDPAPPAGGSLNLSVEGDSGSPVVLVLGLRPAVPLLDLRSIGLGMLWPDLTPSVTANLGTVPAGGTFASSLAVLPLPGLVLHSQVVVQAGGNFRLSNGAASQVQ